MPFARLAASLGPAEKWFLPGECLQCHSAVGPDDPLICAPCQSRWRRLPEPQCPRCGQPVLNAPDVCRVCAAWPDGLMRARSAVWLDANARGAVHLLKYAGWWRVADPMARLMARVDPPLQPGILVPIPLGSKRARARGYNQAEKLAIALGRHAGLAVDAGLLSRARETPSQTALAPEARRANIADAFECRALESRAHIVLVDDVFTTGATLVEAAVTLLEAGALTVDAVTFARAQPPLGKADS